MLELSLEDKLDILVRVVQDKDSNENDIKFAKLECLAAVDYIMEEEYKYAYSNGTRDSQ